MLINKQNKSMINFRKKLYRTRQPFVDNSVQSVSIYQSLSSGIDSLSKSFYFTDKGCWILAYVYKLSSCVNNNIISD